MADWKRPEVLAPAGDFERLVAAVQYGADAVYLGGKDFGMRASPMNFTEEELVRAVDFCHRRGGAGGVNSPPVDAGVYRYFA